MRTVLRRTALSVSALTLTTAGTLSIVSPANAAANFTIPGVCGSSYYQVYSQTESGYDKSSDGWGTVVYIKIGYSPVTGKNCAFIQKSTTNYSYGQESGLSIALRRQKDGAYDYDGGSYKYFAGPVKLSAPNQCVSADGWDDWAGHWSTGWHACD
ncbi:spore-associated protein A [Actinoallomurus vinaceus]|uniref:Spore-associated protein A n=1 Tax=Actinoallomurus vinaceus TaxID=1080074 RepID=A0ABP8UI19_9ACTN